MTFQKIYSEYKPFIVEEMNQFFSEKKNEFEGKNLSLHMIEVIEKAATDGKMLRGLLILLFSENKEDLKEYIKASAAIEIFHTGLLIQDDIMDNDTVRRGKEAVFYSLAKEAKVRGVQDEMGYGKSIAMCVGDLSYFLSLELLSQMNTIAEQKLQILQSFFEEMQQVAIAQVADYTYGITAAEPTFEEILTVYRYKTARYTFSLPFKTGGTLRGFDKNTLSQLLEIGEKIGILFQIKDDELGILGDEKLLGKVIGSDIRENKKTIYRYYLFKHATGQERELLSTLFGSHHDLTKDQVRLVTDLMAKHSVFGQVQAFVHAMEEELKTSLELLPIPPDLNRSLSDVFAYVLKRNK